MKREIRLTTRYLFRWLICTGAITVQGISPVIARAEQLQGLTNAISTHVLVQPSQVLVQPSSCPPTGPIAGISRADLSRQLSSELSWRDLNSRYQKLMIRHHPDMPGGDPQVARMLNEVYSNHPANPNHPNNPLNKARRIYDLWEREDDIFARQRGLMPDPGAVEAPKGRGRFLWRFFRGKIAKAWTAKEILELPLLPLEMGFAYEAHMRRMGEAQVFTAFSRLKGTVGEERYCQALERHAEAWGYSVDRHNWGVRSKEFSAGGSPVYWYYFPIEASAEWYHATDPEEWLSVYGIPELDAATIMYNWDQQRYRGVETLSPLEVLNR